MNVKSPIYIIQDHCIAISRLVSSSLSPVICVSLFDPNYPYSDSSVQQRNKNSKHFLFGHSFVSVSAGWHVHNKQKSILLLEYSSIRKNIISTKLKHN